MIITIHTPSAGIRAITVNGTPGRFIIKTEGKLHRLIDKQHQFGIVVGTSTKVRPLEFALREYLS